MLILLNSLFSQRVVGYYPKWMHDDFPASYIDLSVVTHVIHAFAWPDNDTNADIIPTHLSLHAYPNSFNPVCNIEIELATEEHVQLNVFSVNGQHLATLVDDRLQKGRYSFAWNGRNENNGSMSSSLYFIELTGEKSHLVKKVIYLK